MAQTYEERKKNILTRYHTKLKFDEEYIRKQKIYYKNWYEKNKKNIQYRRKNKKPNTYILFNNKLDINNKNKFFIDFSV